MIEVNYSDSVVMVTGVDVEDSFTETNVVLLHGIKRILQHIKWNLWLTVCKTCTHILPGVNILQFYTSALKNQSKKDPQTNGKNLH